LEGIIQMTDEALTMTVPEAGRKYLKLGRNASYQAASVGQIPTIRVGRLLRVPRAAMDQLMAMAASEATNRTVDAVPKALEALFKDARPKPAA
jgi:excisionase family DNA binding protein